MKRIVLESFSLDALGCRNRFPDHRCRSLHDKAVAKRPFRSPVECVHSAVVASAGQYTQSGAEQRGLHPHPADCAVELLADLLGTGSTPNGGEAECWRRFSLAGPSFSDRLSCEVLGGVHARATAIALEHVRPRDLVDSQRAVLLWSTDASSSSISAVPSQHVSCSLWPAFR
jgi:hypothetical protein